MAVMRLAVAVSGHGQESQDRQGGDVLFPGQEALDPAPGKGLRQFALSEREQGNSLIQNPAKFPAHPSLAKPAVRASEHQDWPTDLAVT